MGESKKSSDFGYTKLKKPFKLFLHLKKLFKQFKNFQWQCNPIDTDYLWKQEVVRRHLFSHNCLLGWTLCQRHFGIKIHDFLLQKFELILDLAFLIERHCWMHPTTGENNGEWCDFSISWPVCTILSGTPTVGEGFFEFGSTVKVWTMSIYTFHNQKARCERCNSSISLPVCTVLSGTGMIKNWVTNGLFNGNIRNAETSLQASIKATLVLNYDDRPSDRLTGGWCVDLA